MSNLSRQPQRGSNAILKSQRERFTTTLTLIVLQLVAEATTRTTWLAPCSWKGEREKAVRSFHACQAAPYRGAVATTRLQLRTNSPSSSPTLRATRVPTGNDQWRRSPHEHHRSGST